jgi:hypothetical protein
MLLSLTTPDLLIFYVKTLRDVQCKKIATSKLNSAIRILEPWLENWRFKIMMNECSILLFYKRRSHCQLNLSSIKLFPIYINWTDQVKDLGVTLDSKLTYYKYHTGKSLCAANHRLGQLYSVLINSFHTNIRLALTIYGH